MFVKCSNFAVIASENIKYLISSDGVSIMGINVGDLVSVYSVNGILVAQNKVVANQAQIALAKGMYILRVNNKAEKLIIK